jgi:hypothetical protein
MPQAEKTESDAAIDACLVRPLASGDIASLEPILREHIRDLLTGAVVEDEVRAVLGYMRGAPDALGRIRTYQVACDASGQAIACMALAEPDPVMSRHLALDGAEAVELLNAFVSAGHGLRKGVGRGLFEASCALGRMRNASCLVVNSGPRYKHSWGFYDRVCDASHGCIAHYYGPSRHAKTWKKDLGRPAGQDTAPAPYLPISSAPAAKRSIE